jgi:hypothetical protein
VREMTAARTDRARPRPHPRLRERAATTSSTAPRA